MRGELVALDLETTGLNIEEAHIIEIGAVRFRDGVFVEEFQTLIDPEIELPTETTFITGIHDEDLKGAPKLEQVLPQLERFIGSAPLVAHNADFDVTFLRKYHILQENTVLDTLEIASVCLPSMSSYGLSSLAKHFGIELGNMHRALDDSKVTALLYHQLWQTAQNLPYAIVAEIVQKAQSLPRWSLLPFFSQLLQTYPAKPFKSFIPSFTQTTKALPNTPPALTHPAHFEPSYAESIFAERGVLAQQLPHYEHRSAQVQMAQAIAEAFNHAQHLLIEAGTGVGKSFAYLAPALAWARQTGERVVLSTQTIQLQDQLVERDLPALQSLLGTDVSVALMKGRANYLCLHRLERLRQRPIQDEDTLRTLAKILIWLSQGGTGDKSNISLRLGEHSAWQLFNAEEEGCTFKRCELMTQGQCPLYQARQKAESAQVLVVNHALLMADALSPAPVLPEYQHLIIDEAHQLDESVTNSAALKLDEFSFSRRLKEIGGIQQGLLHESLFILRQSGTEKQVAKLEAFAGDIQDVVRLLTSNIQHFFSALVEFIHEQDHDGAGIVRITSKQRHAAGFSRLHERWGRLDEYLEVLVGSLDSLASALTSLIGRIADLAPLVDSFRAIQAIFTEQREGLKRFFAQPSGKDIYWMSTTRNGSYTVLHIAPLHVGELLQEHLWSKKKTLILTSATLQTEAGFEYTKERLGAQNAKTAEFPSPFDYRQSTLIYIPRDIPEPIAAHRRDYQRHVEKGIIELAAALEGRILVLFTSYTHLRETAANIAPRLKLGNIELFEQGGGASREALLEGFRQASRAVLMGTRSFWQGVDLPNEQVIGLVIVRLPFAVPTEPVFAARSESYSDPFHQYAVPDAILRFRQGFGRLIRTQQDKGVVAIFDSRIITKDYGQAFLDALPDCTVHMGSLAQLAGTATQWMTEKP